MKIIKPSFEILTFEDNPLQKLERCGRICYKSEERITETSNEKFVKSILFNHHESVLEHANATVIITLDRAVGNELVRHRLASYSQESTRFVNYEKKGVVFVLPCQVSDRFLGEHIVTGRFPDRICEALDLSEILSAHTAENTWFWALDNAEKSYLELLELGWKPEEARDVLPLCTKTEIAVTANFREWRHIFSMRTPHSAHPNMRKLMVEIKRDFQTRCPIIFNDII